MRWGEQDVLLAIGGGSVIDTAKSIAAGTCYDGDVWDLIEDSSKIIAALPVYTVLTLTEVGIGEEKLELMAENCAPKLANAFVPLTKEDVLAIFKDCL